jgi:hypothetical protein
MTAAADMKLTEEEVSVQGETHQVQVPGLGNVVSTFAFAGSSNTQAKKLNITGLHLTSATPSVVIVQPRQSDNQDHNWGDEFAVQVISTTNTSVLCLIRRLDGASGWGQNLRLDLLIVDQTNNP